MDTKKYNEELIAKIMIGIEKSHQKLLATKKKNKEELIIIRDNQIVRVKP